LVGLGLATGQAYQGGKVAYVDGTGHHGLIAATEDQSAGIRWAIAAYQNTAVGGTGTAIGTGAANTALIVTQNGAGITYAAGLVDAYTNPDTGTGVYSDWYLPSKDELAQLYTNRAAIGGFDERFAYWSSSEYNWQYAWRQSFYNGAPDEMPKYVGYRVRAVRAF
jgi:hypothetical protein